MSSNTPGFTEDDRVAEPQGKLNAQYEFTPEELRILRECQRESFWYRALPMAAFSMAATNFLIVKGVLTTKSRFGAIPKVCTAGLFGYLIGKMSYVEECQKKFEVLKDSPVADKIRRRKKTPPESDVKSELEDPGMQSFNMYQQTDAPSQMPTYSSDYGYGPSSEPHMQTHRADDYNTPAQSYLEEEQPKRKTVLYEDLRRKNRENYEVTLTQRAEIPVKTSPPEQPKKKEAKNIYGDTWEE